MRRVFGHRFRRTTLVAVFCAAVLVGIGLARVVHFELSWLLLAGLFLLCTARQQRMAVLLLAVLAGVCLGGWQGTRYMDMLAQYASYANQTVTLVGRAAGDGTYGRQSQLTFDLQDVEVAGGGEKLVGVVGVSGFGENVVFRGDTVQVIGKLRKGSGSHQGWMSFAQISLVERETSPIEKLRRQFGAGMMTALPEPMASFGMGILIGQRSTLPDEVHQDLLMVGLVHIIAVSGYNLTIILRAGMKLFGNRSKYQTMLFSISLIIVFLLLTGSSASIVRASIVSGLSIAAWYYGRAFRPVALILLAAVITSLANPLYVWCDLGWYLSFLAFYGVLVLAPQIRYRFVPQRFRDNVLLGIALESICAEIMTLPLVLYIFGQMSHVSLLANVVIAAFVPIAMLLTVIAGLAGMLLMPIAGWIAWPAVLVLTYMLDMARLLASIPHVFAEGIGFPFVYMVAGYLLVLAFNLLVYSRLRANRAIITAVHEEHTLLRLGPERSEKAAYSR
ncbi:MAG TPA: ComEC/Rec2 family competence protein [Candidatus Saccharimonadales bacterium]|nr:ComEC/Rec2 family competence protein [Candidatus Saccharimonadales bacterium]